MSDESRTAEDLHKAGELKEVSELLWAEYNKARDLQTKAIDDFDKSLWLTNSGAATITIGYITSSDNPTIMQLIGSGIFVMGILSLVAMKFIGEYNAVRDSERRFSASGSFFKNGAKLSIFEKIRDKKFDRLTWFYRKFKAAAGLCFVAGCIVTLVGLYPLIEGKTHNKGLHSTSGHSHLLCNKAAQKAPAASGE
ncbi:hypothetical protein [Oceanicoccus sp. KOV_DT_Chl]|uniref:hypothetical protein n=1 Tax=Oceanicoccus sp. KOV_DT_Chl TaxID=1904639 RepID=UPI000C7A67E1|nr:hypothetical protein [Oceanicoccus sp. KOV_DT_Chl]